MEKILQADPEFGLRSEPHPKYGRLFEDIAQKIEKTEELRKNGNISEDLADIIEYSYVKSNELAKQMRDKDIESIISIILRSRSTRRHMNWMEAMSF